jgi:hypothetical protein
VVQAFAADRTGGYYVGVGYGGIAVAEEEATFSYDGDSRLTGVDGFGPDSSWAMESSLGYNADGSVTSLWDYSWSNT